MRTGFWPDTEVRASTARAILNGVTRDVESVTLTSEMTPALAIATGAGDPVTDGSLTWPQEEEVATISPQPFDRLSAGWPPVTGSPLAVEVGDGAGQWWRQATGTVEASTGRITDPQVRSQIVDAVDQLSAPVTHEPLLTVMPPRLLGGPIRRVALAGSYVSDLAARAAGFCATPPVGAYCLMSAPCMGSVWPEVGACESSQAWQDPNNSPASYASSWGVAAYGADTFWVLTSAVSAAVLTVSLTAQPGGETVAFSTIQNDDGCGVVIRHTADDQVTVSALTPGESPPLVSLPRNGVVRAAVYARTNNAANTLDVTLRLADGREANGSSNHARFASPLLMNRAHLYGAGVMGGLMVDGFQAQFAALAHQPTALFRFSDPQRLTAMPALKGGTALTLLTAQARAQGASMWIDSRNRLRWADRGVLEADPAAVVKSTELTVDDLAWSDNLESLRQQVTVRRRVPALAISTTDNITLHEPGSTNLTPGQVVETWVEPSTEEDWIQPDLDPVLLSTTTRGVIGINTGSYYGATLASDVQNAEDSEAWASTTIYSFTVEEVDGKIKVRHVADAFDGTKTLVTKIPDSALNVPSWARGRSLPVIRGRARTAWTDTTDTRPTGGASGGTYEHDTDWFVQDAQRREELFDWLTAATAAPTPTIDSVAVDPDPRLEIGDKITIRDETRTGLELDLVITRIEQTWDASPSMTLGGRLTRLVRVTTPTDPPSSWDTLLAGWRSGA